MKKGDFYFISDGFYDKYDKEGKLMKNKEGVHNRPCFYAFEDKKEPGILWCVPISSQVDKFEKIVQNKLEQQKKKGIENPTCNTIRFGLLLGKPKAFLIQNMFPVTEKYISNIYLDPNTQNPVTIQPVIEKDVVNNALHIKKLVARGYEYLLFTNVNSIYKELVEELNVEKRRKEIAVDIEQHGFTASKTLVDNIEKFNRQLDKNHSFLEINEIHKSKAKLPEETQETLNEIAKECQMQELEKLQQQEKEVLQPEPETCD